jgi:hypothetical protein
VTSSLQTRQQNKLEHFSFKSLFNSKQDRLWPYSLMIGLLEKLVKECC